MQLLDGAKTLVTIVTINTATVRIVRYIVTDIWIIVFFSHWTYLSLPVGKYFTTIQIIFADSDVIGGTYAVFINFC